ncbi:MAG TPA: phosphatase PAP2 family protein [Verrucomicrobiae bacterium]|nr:phosphatase PAP2 family protein [Verrucomicrobiae bacterium]
MKLHNHFARLRGLYVAAHIFGFMLTAPLWAVDPEHYLAPGTPDVAALLPPPPTPDSPEQAAELAAVRAVFHTAPSNDIASAYAEKKFSVFNFRPVVGDFLAPGKLPKTEAFFSRVQKEAALITDGAKMHWKRPRPFVTDPSLTNGVLEKSFSYPSGHATESMVLALVLAQMFPEKSDAILAEARAIGWHRIEIARHYPIDIFAGRILAQAIVREMWNSAKFQEDFNEAKAEILGRARQP